MALVHPERHVIDWPTFGWPDRWRRLFDLGPEEGGWLRVEEFHDGDTLVVRAELPGIDPDKDVEVTVSDGVVKIHARREEKTEHKDKRGYRTEFRYGSFDREVAIPAGVSAEDVTAGYTDGVLEVRVPCPAEPKSSSTTVPVSRG